MIISTNNIIEYNINRIILKIYIYIYNIKEYKFNREEHINIYKYYILIDKISRTNQHISIFFMTIRKTSSTFTK